jgi:hypothetical protein
MLNVIMLSPIMLSAILLIVVMLSVMVPDPDLLLKVWLRLSPRKRGKNSSKPK